MSTDAPKPFFTSLDCINGRMRPREMPEHGKGWAVGDVVAMVRRDAYEALQQQIETLTADLKLVRENNRINADAAVAYDAEMAALHKDNQWALRRARLAQDELEAYKGD